MINVTEGYKNLWNLKVFRTGVVDNVRFMITCDGIDICAADSDCYFIPMHNGSDNDYFEYRITDADRSAPALTAQDGADIREYLDYWSAVWAELPKEWIAAADKL